MTTPRYRVACTGHIGSPRANLEWARQQRIRIEKVSWCRDVHVIEEEQADGSWRAIEEQGETDEA